MIEVIASKIRVAMVNLREQKKSQVAVARLRFFTFKIASPQKVDFPAAEGMRRSGCAGQRSLHRRSIAVAILEKLIRALEPCQGKSPPAACASPSAKTA
jgi:hypothetical protein